MERPMRTFYLQPKLEAADPTVVTGPYPALVSPKSEGDTTIYDGMEVVLCADLNLAPPYTVAWLRGGTVIPGATQTYDRFRERARATTAAALIRINGTVGRADYFDGSRGHDQAGAGQCGGRG